MLIFITCEIFILTNNIQDCIIQRCYIKIKFREEANNDKII